MKSLNRQIKEMKNRDKNLLSTYEKFTEEIIKDRRKERILEEYLETLAEISLGELYLSFFDNEKINLFNT